MLQTIRDRAQGVFIWVILGLIIVPFALFGINNYFSGNTDTSKVATVNGEDISQTEYRMAFGAEQQRLRQMFGENFDLTQFDDTLKQSAMNNVVQRAVLREVATKSGFIISDAQVAKAVHEIPNFQEEGKFSKSLYETVLKGSGQSVASFEQRLRGDLLLQQLTAGLSSSAFATASDVAQKQKLEQQERELGYVTLAVNDFKGQVAIDEAAIKQHYDNNQARYQTEEQVSLQYLELSSNTLSNDIEVTDDELQDYFESQQDRFRTGEERRARHILINVDAKTNDDAAKKKIEDVQARLKKGEAFDAVAKQVSQDSDSAKNGGDLGFFGKGIMDKAFEEAAFSLAVGQVSGPVRSQFGYHIIKLEEIKASKGKTLADVRGELTTQLKREKANKLFSDKADKFANLTYENSDSLEPAAHELGLQIKKTGFFSRAGGPGILSNPKVREAAFSEDVLKRSVNSEVIEISESNSVVVRLDEHKPAKLRPLDEVRAGIVDELKAEKAKQLAKEKGEVVLKELNAGKRPEQVAKDSKLTWNSPSWNKRSGGKLPGHIATQGFKLAKPESGKTVFGSMTAPNGDFVVIGLSGVRDSTDKPAEGDKTQAANALSSAYGNEQLGALVKALEADAEVERFPNNIQ